MMEQEKKEYRKNRERENEREREKEKERERERLAMERMAMERRRQDRDYRVTFHNHALRNMCCSALGAKCFCSLRLFLHQTLFPLWRWSRNFLFSLQLNPEEVVRPRTRDEYENQRQRNHNKPARYKTLQEFFLQAKYLHPVKKCIAQEFH